MVEGEIHDFDLDAVKYEMNHVSCDEEEHLKHGPYWHRPFPPKKRLASQYPSKIEWDQIPTDPVQ